MDTPQSWPVPMLRRPLAEWLAMAPGAGDATTALRLVAYNLALRRTIVWMVVPLSLAALGGGLMVASEGGRAAGVGLIVTGLVGACALLAALAWWRGHPVPSSTKLTAAGRAPSTVRGAWGSFAAVALVCTAALTWSVLRGDHWSAPAWFGALVGPIVLAAILLLPQALCLRGANARLRRLIAADPRVRTELDLRARTHDGGLALLPFGPL